MCIRIVSQVQDIIFELSKRRDILEYTADPSTWLGYKKARFMCSLCFSFCFSPCPYKKDLTVLAGIT